MAEEEYPPASTPAEQTHEKDVAAELRSTSSSETSCKSDQPAVQRPTPLRWFLVCVGLYLAALLYGLDTTIAADVQASVYKDLGNIEKLPWVGIGFPLGSVAVILLTGRLYGAFEIKWLIIGSFTLFEVGSALCGAAPNSNALILGRVIAGMGGAGMYLGGLTYISVFTSLREQALYNALIGLSWGIGAILGPVIGGGFAESRATWRWAFYINLPLAAATLPIYIFLFPRYNPQPKMAARAKFVRLDWIGAFFNALTFVLFMVVLTFSGSLWPWDSGTSTALWVVFAVSLVCYVVQQTFSIFTTPERRLFPVQFHRSRTLLLMYFTTAATSCAMSTTLYYIPLFFQFTKGDSALKAAVRLLPFIIVFVFSVMFSGALAPIVGRYAPWYFPASIIIIVGGTLMFLVTSTTHTAAIYGFEIMIGIGTGLIFQLGYSVAAAKVKANDVPASIGFINVAQIGTIAISLSIAGFLFQNLGYHFLKEALVNYHFSESALRSALAGTQSVILGQKGEVVRKLATDAIVKTISKVYALVFSAGVVALVSACFMSWEKLQLEPAAGC